MHKLTNADAAVIATWVHTPEEVVEFAGPQMPYPMNGADLMSSRHQGYEVFSFFVNEELVGTTSVRLPDSTTARIARVLLNPILRGRGLGRKIVSATIDYCQNTYAVEKLELGVYLHNIPARKLYESLGFIDTGRRRKTFINHQWWMAVDMVKYC